MWRCLPFTFLPLTGCALCGSSQTFLHAAAVTSTSGRVLASDLFRAEEGLPSSVTDRYRKRSVVAQFGELWRKATHETVKSSGNDPAQANCSGNAPALCNLHRERACSHAGNAPARMQGTYPRSRRAPLRGRPCAQLPDAQTRTTDCWDGLVSRTNLPPSEILQFPVDGEVGCCLPCDWRIRPPRPVDGVVFLVTGAAPHGP